PRIERAELGQAQRLIAQEEHRGRLAFELPRCGAVSADDGEPDVSGVVAFRPVIEAVAARLALCRVPAGVAVLGNGRSGQAQAGEMEIASVGAYDDCVPAQCLDAVHAVREGYLLRPGVVRVAHGVDLRVERALRAVPARAGAEEQVRADVAVLDRGAVRPR